MGKTVIYTAFLLGLLIYTGVNVAASPDYTKSVLIFATNMLIAIMGLQALDGELDTRPICSRMPRAVKVLASLVYIFVLVVTMLVIITGMKMVDNNVTNGAILNFIKNMVAAVVALVATNVMERAAKACDVIITLAMLFMALAFGLIVVVGL
jgi:cytochrome b561